MTVQLAADGRIVLSQDCPSDDAEPLLQYLLASPAAAVDWRDCQSAHAAVIQVLLVARRRMLGPPAGDILSTWIEPLLTVHPP